MTGGTEAQQWAAPESEARGATAEWWRSGVIYQIYPRSFADGNGDGMGDLEGVRQRLDYLHDLGVDALWLTPWYRSPMVDGGYDVADYRSIDPMFGSLEDAERLIAEAAARGMRVLIDIVPNHVSDQHAWFQEALTAGPGSAQRERFWFRPGRGRHGELPPNSWQGSFGGSTWTRVTEADGQPGEWYLHLFAPQQPDLNWSNPQVIHEHEQILRFWFDRGVAGVRIDSATFLVKDPELPEVPAAPVPGDHPHMDREELHDLYRGWRRIADEYEPQRILVGEVWLQGQDRMVRYLRPGEMHTAFNFDFMVAPWDPRRLRLVIEQTLDAHSAVAATPTWVLSNHDVTRPVTRYGREDSAFDFATKRFGTPTQGDLGMRRARAAALLAAALPGCLYIYQGDELGLPEVEDLPLSVIQDPMHERSSGVDPGRDGCRVPLPWTRDDPTFGFSPIEVDPWLPQPTGWGGLSAQAQDGDPASMLSLYRRALAIRARDLRAENGFRWLPGGSTDTAVIAFGRGDDFVCITNFGPAAVDRPQGFDLLLSSQDGVEDTIAADVTVWLRRREAE